MACADSQGATGDGLTAVEAVASCRLTERLPMQSFLDLADVTPGNKLSQI
ncbi:Aldo/keto reductase [Pseudomonas syringae pv. syringae]|nr:Aldo/keto reductase [Pseudomonas syringae pv. aceris]KPB16028.1 Aldo/keto reductase [Pseudomonas syringae pv. syringae]MCF5281847.1 hypothetical protein [Pseudomonas syringae]MCF5299433.1 hypothetical protein [Pseudomonas syringae]